MKTTITLKEMTFHARHGVLEQERAIGGTYTVDVSYTVETTATDTDNIADTVSYADIYDIVKDEMQKPSNLIEHVAARILRAIKQQFKQIQNITIKVSKHNPPVNGEIAKATVLVSV